MWTLYCWLLINYGIPIFMGFDGTDEPRIEMFNELETVYWSVMHRLENHEIQYPRKYKFALIHKKIIPTI